nr:putative ribonuclease H-like domain-containing protein [Tanacetum cinerariifolium]
NRRWRYNLTPVKSKFKTPMLDHQDKYMMKAQTVPRTAQQNDIVERQNRTLVEAARTMLIFYKAPMFLWAEAVATACYTQNRSLIHTRHNKTLYELVHNKKPDLTFFRVCGALCYPINDSEDLRKLQPTTDIGIFIGYAPSRKGPAPMFMMPGQISSGLVPNPVPATPYVPPTDKDLEILFQPMFDEYLEPPRIERPVSPAQAIQAPVNSAGTPHLPPLIKMHLLQVFHHHLRLYNLVINALQLNLLLWKTIPLLPLTIIPSLMYLLQNLVLAHHHSGMLVQRNQPTSLKPFIISVNGAKITHSIMSLATLLDRLLKTYDGGSLTAHEFRKKFIGTVRFKNDHFGAIMGYGDYVIGDSVISRTVPRTPQQNSVVERRNRTLVEAARTMLIFSKAPMFLWAKAVATACYTQNRSLIHTRHHKTPYELVHNKKPDLTFFRVFGALCYPTNNSKDLGKL